MSQEVLQVILYGKFNSSDRKFKIYFGQFWNLFRKFEDYFENYLEKFKHLKMGSICIFKIFEL